MFRSQARCLAMLASAILSCNATLETRAADFLCDGKTDNLPAFNDAIAALPKGGGLVAIPAGICRLSGTLNITKPIRLSGTVSSTTNAGIAPGTVLLFDRDRNGIIVDRHDTLDDRIVPESSAPGGDDSILENLLVQSAGGKTVVHGIWLRARATIRNVNVDGFRGNGIRIVATTKGSPETHGNANNWRVDKIRITRSGGDGFFVGGSDANAGVGIEIDSSGNGGWGIYDSGFLGDTYIGAHVSDNRLGAYKTDNVNARHVLIGCYSEGGQPPSSLVAPALVVGGLHGAGFTVDSSHGNLNAAGWTSSRGFRVASPADDSKGLGIAVGGANEVLSARAFGDAPSGFQFMYKGGTYEWRSGRLDSRRAQVFTTELNDGRVEKISLESGGSGYSRATVRISGGGGSGAEAEAVLSAGAVVAIKVRKAGTRYSGKPEVTIDGDGTGAVAHAHVSVRIMAGRTDPLPPGQSIFPQGVFIGASGNHDDARLQSNAAAMPSKGNYGRGDFVWNRNPAEAGNPGAKYILLGWMRLTAGSGNVPNVDWVNVRVPTGN